MDKAAKRSGYESPATEYHRVLWLLVGLASALFPHIGRLPVWILVLLAGIGTWRLRLARLGKPLPGRVVRLAFALTSFAAIMVTYAGKLNGLEPGTSLLALMLGLKLLETRAARDFLMLPVLAYFLVLAAFLWQQSLTSLGILAACTWLLTASLLQAAHGEPLLGAARTLRLAGRYLAMAAPLAIALFLLFPRVPGPFWSIPKPGDASRSGLNEEMQPGSIAKLILSDEVAFRVSFDDRPPLARFRYWRGPVLENFDGLTWRRAKGYNWPIPNNSLEFLSPPIAYRIDLEPHGRHWLFALDMPSLWPREATLYRQWELRRQHEPVNQRTTFELVSHTDYRARIPLREGLMRLNTYLPEGRNPRTTRLAAELLAGTSSREEYIQTVLALFREQSFVYTLEPARLGQQHPVDDFLFETREGFCEHYASAFTVLMRAAGIPSRVVTGYQGGELNPLGNYYIVRQADAHAWSEVWIEETGWVRHDPTGWIAPERIENGLAEALRRGGESRGFLADWRVFRGARMAWDAINNGWNNWVLGFDSFRQIDLFRWLGFSHIGWPTYLLTLTGAMIISFVLVNLLLGYKQGARDRDPVDKLYARFCRRLARRKLDRQPHEGPRDFARRVATRRPDLAAQVRQITACYVYLRYAGGDPERALPRLRRLVGDFRP